MRTVISVIGAIVDEYFDGMLTFCEVEDEEKLSDLATGFDAFTEDAVVGCVGAIDGLAIRIEGPSEKDCSNPRTYFNRKHFFSVNLQAMCDSKRRFRWMSFMCPGSTHDATAFACSGFEKQTEALVALGCWIAADDAYPVSEHFITPFPGIGIPEDEDNFNFYQSRLQIVIECAFGMLVRRYQYPPCMHVCLTP